MWNSLGNAKATGTTGLILEGTVVVKKKIPSTSSNGREEWMKETKELQEVCFGPMSDKRLDEIWIADASWMPELPAGVGSWCL